MMKFGINIINFGPDANAASLKRWAEFAEELGFHLVMISDHVAVTPDIEQAGYPAPFYDPFVSLSWLAGALTTEIELGTTVMILPYRHPLLTARMAAGIDQLSGGRFILGVGVGWARQEFAALGVPFEKRGALSDEYLEVIKRCWANDVVSYEGPTISFKNVHTKPRPVRATGLPIWVGGSSERALRRAVRFGDAWHPIGDAWRPYRFSLDWLKEKALPKLKEIAEIEEKPVPAFCPRLRLRLTSQPVPEEGPEGRRSMGHGSMDQIRADLEAMASLEAAYVVLDTFTYDGSAAKSSTPGSAAFDEDLAMLAAVAEQVLDLEGQTLR